MMRILPFVICLMLCFLADTASGQIVVSGMVADSVSFEPLPETSIKLKRAGKGTFTNDKGFFTIISPGYDTLLITRLGYEPYEYVISETERDILLLIRESVETLQEIVIIAPDEKPIHRQPREVKALQWDDAFVSPFSYFSKEEKQKRMLIAYQQEQQKVQVYLDLVTRIQFRYEIMDIFSISETQYYNLLVAFNSERRDVQYFSDEEQIRQAVISFFEKSISESETP